MLRLKRLSKEGVAGALVRADRYRLLSEPGEAESICLDVLEVEPDNQKALVTLLLALTEQFRQDEASHAGPAREVLPKLHDGYLRRYYAGIICERWAKAHLELHGPGAGLGVYDLLQEAMAWYEKAEAIRPQGQDDALLRWNACARTLNRHSELTPE
jgi:hypothetical protein